MRARFLAAPIATVTILASPAIAQVVPDASLDTSVDRAGETFTIDGGTTSQDGTNLFHSFEAFGLEVGQTANFIATPEVQNVLGRVTGGDASSIDGLLQVTGSSADLFLMNPAGIIFGENARLDVAGDFTATTAGGIEFADGWFDALRSGNEIALTGEPIALDFSAAASGAIASFGALSVGDGASLSLVGETVILGGSVAGGRVSVTAIEGGRRVRLRPSGSVLGIEMATSRLGGRIEPIALPELLTGGEVASAETLEVVDGVVRLSGAEVSEVTAGDVAVVGTIAGTGEVRLSATDDVTVATDLNFLNFAEGSGAIAIEADADESGVGSTIAQSIVAPGQDVTVSGASVTLGHIETGAAAGGGDVTIAARTGDLTSGNIFTHAISDSLAQTGAGGTVRLSAAGDLVAGHLWSSASAFSSGSSDVVDVTDSTATIEIDAIPESELAAIEGGIDGGAVSVRAGGDVTLGRVRSSSLFGNGGTIDVTAGGELRVDYTDSSAMGNGGAIRLTAEGGSVALGDATSLSGIGNGGAIDITAIGGSIVGGELNSSSLATIGAGESGAIRLTAEGGSVTTGDILATSSTNPDGAGNVSIFAARDIVTTGTILLRSQLEESSAIESDFETQIPEVGSTTDTIFQPASSAIDTTTPNTASRRSSTNTTSDPLSSISRFLPSEIVIPTGGASSTTIALEDVPASDTMTNSALRSPSGEVAISATDDIRTGDIISGDVLLEAGGRVAVGQVFTQIAGAIGSRGAGELVERDADRSAEYLDYLGRDLSLGSLADTRGTMALVEAETGTRSGIVYISLRDTAVDISLIVANKTAITTSLPVDRDMLLATVDRYRRNLANPRSWRNRQYNRDAAQLYDWLIRPIADDLEAENIDTLMLSLDAGLRGLPMAALYDGDRYLVERYSLSLVPSIGLIDTRYRALGDRAPMLAMGASEFENLAPLPAVPAELNALVTHRRAGKVFLNEEFTRKRMLDERQKTPFPIVHLATHGEFNAGAPSNSYIQFWDERVGLDEIRELGWSDPAVELLVLSACRTALGSDEAEMGFAGLAVAAGVKTAIASLWYVNDAATFLLMTELYEHLATAPIKAEALREAQLALIRGEVRIEDGVLYTADAEPIALPESLAYLEDIDFSHPYYWSAFTAIGAPW